MNCFTCLVYLCEVEFVLSTEIVCVSVCINLFSVNNTTFTLDQRKVDCNLWNSKYTIVSYLGNQKLTRTVGQITKGFPVSHTNKLSNFNFLLLNISD